MKSISNTVVMALAATILFAPLGACAPQPETPPATGALGLFGVEQLVNAAGEKVHPSTLSNKTVAVYFSAYWCPPCRAFTPVLVEFYNKLKADKKPFEIVFVSGDENKPAMETYMKDMKMPWPAVPYDSPKTGQLKTRFGIFGFPFMIVLRPDGTLITRDGVRDVAQFGESAFDKWK